MDGFNQSGAVLKDYQKPWFIILMLVVFFPVGLFLMWKYAAWNNTIKWIVTGLFGFLLLVSWISSVIPVEIPNVVNEDHSAAVRILEDKEFTNITLFDQNGNSISESQLSNETLIIKQEPQAGQEVTTDTEIKLTVRDIGREKEEAARKERERINKILQSLVNKNLKTATATVKGLKYNFSLYNDNGVNMSDGISKKDYSNWIVIKVKTINHSSKKVGFVVSSKEAVKLAQTRKVLNSKLSETDAYYYFAEYGKRMFPYGFKLHYIIGDHSAYAKNTTTWVVKSECSITNGFGATRRVMCQAKVKIKEKENKIRVYDFVEY